MASQCGWKSEAANLTPEVTACDARCIFAEMANGRPLFTGTSDKDQCACNSAQQLRMVAVFSSTWTALLDRIFRQLGTPNEAIYPALRELPEYQPDFAQYPTPYSISQLAPTLAIAARHNASAAVAVVYHIQRAAACCGLCLAQCNGAQATALSAPR
eukprot:14649-Heterococcus_DN1.PRE.3